MSKPPSKPTWKERLIHLRDKATKILKMIFSEHNMFFCIIFVIGSNVIAYLLLWKYADQGFESDLSCALTLISLVVTIWVASWANSIKRTIHNDSVFSGIYALNKKYNNADDVFFDSEPMSREELNDILNEYQFVIDNNYQIGNQIEKVICSEIESIKKALENETAPDAKFSSGGFRSHLKAINDLVTKSIYK